MFNCPSKNTTEWKHIHTKTAEHLLLARIKIQFSNLETSYQLLNLTIAWLSVPIIWLFFSYHLLKIWFWLDAITSNQLMNETPFDWKKKSFDFFFFFEKGKWTWRHKHGYINWARVWEMHSIHTHVNIIHITSSDSDSHCS